MNIITMDQSIEDVDLSKMVIEDLGVVMGLTVIVMEQGNDIAMDLLVLKDPVANIMIFTAMDPTAITPDPGLGAILNDLVLDDVAHLNYLGQAHGKDTGELIATCEALVIMAHLDTEDHALTIPMNAHQEKLTAKINPAALAKRRIVDMEKE